MDKRTIERFNSKVDHSTPDGCWPIVSGAILRSGHRQVWIDGAMRLAHRVAWAIANGPIPDGLCVCHHCDNPPCCNPSHLFLGTVADNNADRDRKGRGVVPPPGVGGRRQGPTVHGSLTAYVKHKCRCDTCRSAMSAYRLNRSAA